MNVPREVQITLEWFRRGRVSVCDRWPASPFQQGTLTGEAFGQSGLYCRVWLSASQAAQLWGRNKWVKSQCFPMHSKYFFFGGRGAGACHSICCNDIYQRPVNGWGAEGAGGGMEVVPARGLLSVTCPRYSAHSCRGSGGICLPCALSLLRMRLANSVTYKENASREQWGEHKNKSLTSNQTFQLKKKSLPLLRVGTPWLTWDSFFQTKTLSLLLTWKEHRPS